MTSKLKTLLLVVTTTFFVPKTGAQNHTNTWFRTTVSIPINEKIKTDIELQHRRQFDFESTNPFDKNLMYAFRTWLYYKQNKDITFAISPFAYFSNYKIIQKETDSNAQPTNEYRFTALVELQHQLAINFYIANRTAVEYRKFEGKVENTTRLRNKMAFKYDIDKTYNITLANEILINTTGTDAQHLFDHNRIISNLSYIPNPKLKFDLGYIYISRLTKNNTNLLEENNLYLNFTYTLKKKK